MRKEYVEKVEGVYRGGSTRVSLDSLIVLFREGMSAESMVESYPALTLEQVHGPLRFTWGTRKRSTNICWRASAPRIRNIGNPEKPMPI